MNTQLVKGSLSAIAQQNNQSIAETFINADVIIIVDTSGSMAACDSRGDRSRYDVACEELKNLQASLPGKLALLSFSDDVIFCPSGVPFNYEGGDGQAFLKRLAKASGGQNVTAAKVHALADNVQRLLLS